MHCLILSMFRSGPASAKPCGHVATSSLTAELSVLRRIGIMCYRRCTDDLFHATPPLASNEEGRRDSRCGLRRPRRNLKSNSIIHDVHAETSMVRLLDAADTYAFYDPITYRWYPATVKICLSVRRQNAADTISQSTQTNHERLFHRFGNSTIIPANRWIASCGSIFRNVRFGCCGFVFAFKAICISRWRLLDLLSSHFTPRRQVVFERSD